MATNTYVALAQHTISSSVASYNFASIPQGYTDLVLILDVVSTSASGNYVHLQYNGDAGVGSLYSTTVYTGTGTNPPTTTRFTNRANFNIDYFATPNTSKGNRIVQIMGYSNSTTFKTAIVRANSAATGVDATIGMWRNTAPITSILITHDTAQFAVGSTFSLYGISTVGDATPKATGGDVYSDATYWYHAFPMSGNFISNQSLTADVLVVAGGGAGGNGSGAYGGGGGAGGYRLLSSQSITSGASYRASVGGGGTSLSASTPNTNGSNSSFIGTGISISSTGGGRAGEQNSPNGGNGDGKSGGSGGGSGVNGSISLNQAGGAGNSGGYSPVEGFAGGVGANAGSLGAGGGGGATAVGANRSGANGGAGGAGSSSASTWGLATTTGENISGTVWYAGGGGAGSGTGGSATVSGGNGGGGVGSFSAPGNGTAGTGGGGGGRGEGTTGAGGNGGSGIVIVRYTKA
jgi:hypothetical protein